MPETQNAWGHPGRYYASQQRQDADTYPQDGRPFVYPPGIPDCKDEVERVLQQWNQPIRHHLATEIGVQLRGQQVRVAVEDGLPPGLQEVVWEFDPLMPLLMNRPKIAAAAAGLGIMQSLANEMEGMEAGVDIPNQKEKISDALEIALAWLDYLDRGQIKEGLREIDEDILGAYFFRQRKIEIYSKAIGFVSAVINVPIDALAFVVLAHELAHAYTHLGFDIDEHRWDTHAFADTDVAVVEGLAQFYTSVVCAKLSSRMPDALKAFNELLEVQNDIYRTHRQWVDVGAEDGREVDDESKSSGEIIRVSLIECRRSRMPWSRDKFLKCVEKRRAEIPKRDSPKRDFSGPWYP